MGAHQVAPLLEERGQGALRVGVLGDELDDRRVDALRRLAVASLHVDVPERPDGDEIVRVLRAPRPRRGERAIEVAGCHEPVHERDAPRPVVRAIVDVARELRELRCGRRAGLGGLRVHGEQRKHGAGAVDGPESGRGRGKGDARGGEGGQEDVSAHAHGHCERRTTRETALSRAIREAPVDGRPQRVCGGPRAGGSQKKVPIPCSGSGCVNCSRLLGARPDNALLRSEMLSLSTVGAYHPVECD